MTGSLAPRRASMTASFVQRRRRGVKPAARWAFSHEPTRSATWLADGKRGYSAVPLRHAAALLGLPLPEPRRLARLRRPHTNRRDSVAACKRALGPGAEAAQLAQLTAGHNRPPHIAHSCAPT